MNCRSRRKCRSSSPSQRNRTLALLAGAVGVMVTQYHVQGATAYFLEPAAKLAHRRARAALVTGMLDPHRRYPGTGATDVAWPNLGTDFAQFSGTAGVVTVAAPINVNRMTFTTTNYSVTFTGANAITFGGTAAEVRHQRRQRRSVVISALILGMGTSTTPVHRQHVRREHAGGHRIEFIFRNQLRHRQRQSIDPDHGQSGYRHRRADQERRWLADTHRWQQQHRQLEPARTPACSKCSRGHPWALPAWSFPSTATARRQRRTAASWSFPT